MTYAIIEAGGKQLRVEPGYFYDINRLPVDEDESVTIDRVLYIEHDGDFHVGQPLVEGASIEATVLRHLRGRKIIVYKMRPKKKTRKKRGHRQELTRLMINAIHLNGAPVAVAEDYQASSQAATSQPDVDDVAESSDSEPETTQATP